MSDGGLVLVDVNEGVSTQTHTVIKQAWAEKVKMCLVLNKIDRLILVRGMDGEQVYHALVQIVEQVNAIIAELIQADMMEGGKVYEAGGFGEAQSALEQALMFAPDKGNVAFASAYDCWSFTLPSFLPTVAEKLGMNARTLQKFMWGEYYYSPSEKKVSQTPPAKLSQVMFVQFIMEPLIAKYRKCFSEEVLQSAALTREAHVKIKERLHKLMPTEQGIFKMVIEHLPAPDQAQGERLKQFCPALTNPALNPALHAVRDAIVGCKQSPSPDDGTPTTVYVTKMQPFSARLYDLTTKAAEKSVEK